MSFYKKNDNSPKISNILLNNLELKKNIKPIYTIKQPIFPKVPSHPPFPKTPTHNPNYKVNVMVINSTN